MYAVIYALAYMYVYYMSVSDFEKEDLYTLVTNSLVTYSLSYSHDEPVMHWKDYVEHLPKVVSRLGHT